MNVVVHVDNSISRDDPMMARIASEVETILAGYEDRVVRVEVHLAEESGSLFRRNDIRCVMEAFNEGQSPAVATDHADTVEEAVRGTAHRLDRVIENHSNRPGNDAARGPVAKSGARDVSAGGW